MVTAISTTCACSTIKWFRERDEIVAPFKTTGIADLTKKFTTATEGSTHRALSRVFPVSLPKGRPGT
ncbi:MAG: hypothetical protein OXF02_04310 [Simkaniaceae bacterium]|nr:hypothetical protein [Simkaniaceae bacterium]